MRSDDGASWVVILSRAVFLALERRAKDEAPREVCGLAAGRIEGGRKQVDDLIFMRNVDPEPSRAYTADPVELLNAIEALERDGKEIIGIFHSHPNGPSRPSAVDVERVAWTDHSHLIMVPGDPSRLTSWVWNARTGGFDEEALEVVG